MALEAPLKFEAKPFFLKDFIFYNDGIFCNAIFFFRSSLESGEFPHTSALPGDETHSDPLVEELSRKRSGSLGRYG